MPDRIWHGTELAVISDRQSSEVTSPVSGIGARPQSLLTSPACVCHALLSFYKVLVEIWPF